MCEKHPESTGTVCGEPVCGTCYGERLLSEPFQTRRPVPPMPTYECCGKQYVVRSDHHRCKEG